MAIQGAEKAEFTPTEGVDDSVDGLYLRAVALQRGGKVAEAESLYRRILADRWDEPDVLDRLFEMLFSQRRLEDARAVLLQSLAARPDSPVALAHMACLLGFLGEDYEAERYHDAALRVAPNAPVARFNHALHLLRQGRWEKGWAEYEWGRVTGARPLRHVEPEWDGSHRVPNREPGTLFVWAEQGQGDSIMCLRFLERAKKQGGFARVVLEVQPSLVPLLLPVRVVIGADAIVAQQNTRTLAGFVPGSEDRHVSLMSLPRVLGVGPADLDGQPYLPDFGGDGSGLAEPLSSSDTRIHVGVCWRGSDTHSGTAWRNVPAEEFAARLTDRFKDAPVKFHLLCPDGGQDIGAFGSVNAPEFWARFDWPSPRTWADTAALLCRLDHLVTVDTAVAHLAGAMGVPTELLLSKAPDWRWMCERNSYFAWITTPWYASVTLRRQETLDDWTGPLHEAGDVIESLALVKGRENRREEIVAGFQPGALAAKAATAEEAAADVPRTT